MKRQVFILGFVVYIIGIFSCENTDLAKENILIQPIANLTSEQLNRYEKGKELFEHSFSLEEGLGPVFITIPSNKWLSRRRNP